MNVKILCIFFSLCITLTSEYRQLETTKLLREESQVSYLLKLMRSTSKCNIDLFSSRFFNEKKTELMMLNIPPTQVDEINLPTREHFTHLGSVVVTSQANSARPETPYKGSTTSGRLPFSLSHQKPTEHPENILAQNNIQPTPSQPV